MATLTEIVTNLEAWAAEVLEVNTYEHQPTSLLEALPLVISEVKRDRNVNQDPDISFGQYEQIRLRLQTVELLIMVHPEPSWTASQTLYGYVDLLAQALKNDPTLGGRVATSSPLYDASFDPPEIQYQDGTVARVATFTMTVGEPMEV